MKVPLGLAVSAASAVLAVGLFLGGDAARAGDAPTETPQPQKKIDHPFANALVGEWTVAYTMADASGQPQTGTAKSKIVLGIGGTALVEDYTGEMMSMPFAGHGVYKVSDDGKTATGWWFDSMAPEPMKMSGPLTNDTMEIEGTTPMGPLKIVMKKVEGGFDWEGSMNGKTWLSQKFRKAR